MRRFISMLIIFSILFMLCSCSGGDTGKLVPMTSSGTQGGAAVSAEFDSASVLFRMAVLSDIHLSYEYHTEEQILNNADRYADAVAYMYHLSGGNLDSIMMCGDYTSIGDINQGTTFAQCTSTIIEGIFGENRPKTVIGMGNHDTCWNGCMTDKQWYELLGEYGLCDGLESDSDYELGNLHLKMSKEGKTCHMLFVETLDYAENVFHADTLRWLDNKLKEITAESPEQYVIVGSHAPILESGVYGTNLTLDGGTNWATAKNNIHNVLKKYPQVVYFSGHNHYAQYLNTTIMQKDYTALNVSGLFSMSYYNSQYNKYLDSSGTGRQGGMGYYIEIDKNGTMKISRVDFSYSGNAAAVEKLSSAQVPNPNYKPGGDYETISVLKLKSCRLTGNKDIKIHGDDFIIPAPDSAKNHLKFYSEKRGDIKKPSFPSGAKVDVFRTSGSTVSVSFPAAAAGEEAYILQYVVSIKNENFEKVAEYKILGNYVDSTVGVATGTSHLDATLFSYSITGLSSMKGCTVEVYAYDEYGNRGGSIFSDTIDI